MGTEGIMILPSREVAIELNFKGQVSGMSILDRREKGACAHDKLGECN